MPHPGLHSQVQSDFWYRYPPYSWSDSLNHKVIRKDSFLWLSRRCTPRNSEEKGQPGHFPCSLIGKLGQSPFFPLPINTHSQYLHHAHQSWHHKHCSTMGQSSKQEKEKNAMAKKTGNSMKMRKNDTSFNRFPEESPEILLPSQFDRFLSTLPGAIMMTGSTSWPFERCLS